MSSLRPFESLDILPADAPNQAESAPTIINFLLSA